MNNCWELDNGVYNKFVYNSPHEDESKQDDKDNESDISKSERSSHNYDKGKVKQKHKKKPEGADAFLNDSLESSFKESTLKSMEEDLYKRKKVTNNSEEEKEDLLKIKMLLEVDQPKNNGDKDMDTLSSNYNFVLEEKIVQATCAFGFPRDYVIKSLENNEANY
mmetsp:Transcript_37933/g.43561  ORF Transcript_37933/g.43561 Transcript_37933/m.43561 type:complete len:164 (-) Transcript_37933:101-592(-)